MKYMLVLQFPEAIFTYSELEEFENNLIRGLRGMAAIDGHDIGAHEINLFIITDNVNLVFNKIKTLLKSEAGKTLKAAYRAVDSDQYHILYPANLKVFHIS